MRAILLFGACLLTCAWICTGCGPRSTTAVPAVQRSHPDTVGPAAEAAQRNTLRIAYPALSRLAPGSEFDVVISASLAAALYQGCGRLQYDGRVLRPLAVQWGELAPQAGVRVAKLDLPAAAAGSGLGSVIPFAFTALPGQSPPPPGSGELVRLRFKLTGVPGAAPALHLANDPETLQLRDAQGRRLSFDLAEEVSAL